MSTIAVTAHTVTSAVGNGLDAHAQALENERSSLAPCTFETVDIPTWVGEVSGVDQVAMPDELKDYDCRNNRLAEMALNQDEFVSQVEQAREQFGDHRIGCFLGTSTGGILSTELAYRQRDENGNLPPDFDYRHVHADFGLTDYLRKRLSIKGPANVISTACSSAAKSYATAARYLRTGLIDAAVVGGVDSLTLTTLYGFHSLQLTSDEPCRPADVNRRGISIGEAAGFALLTRTDEDDDDAEQYLLGWGESADAHHMSSPHPEGLGARLAMEGALAQAGMQPGQVDYINLHGTGTMANDLSEDKAVVALFGTDTPVSSTKGLAGHALGAAGALEASIVLLCLQHAMLPRSLHTREVDPALAADVIVENRHCEVNHVMSNSFGFGGNNASLLFGKHRPEPA